MVYLGQLIQLVSISFVSFSISLFVVSVVHLCLYPMVFIPAVFAFCLVSVLVVFSGVVLINRFECFAFGTFL